ncbi:MAG: glycosyltransferase family 4 protein [Kiritimatiellae bacterium]|nr:glycosyltransferase family 4 protein [Kiritimatiellia bacterium]
MKIAYISSTAFSDVDLSYLSVAQQELDITYYLLLNPLCLRRAAINIQRFAPGNGIFPWSIYPDLKGLEKFVDLGKVRVVNRATRGWHPRTIWVTHQLVKELKREQYDIVHLNWPPTLLSAELLRLRERMVLTMHDPFPHSDENSLKNKIFRRIAVLGLRNFVVLNEAQKERFVEYYRLRDKRVFSTTLSSYIYLRGVSEASVGPMGSPYILFFGQVAKHKGLQVLFPAFRKICEKFPGVKLVAAGRGQYPMDLGPYLATGRYDVRNCFIPDGELVGLIRNALFVVVPYLDATQSGVVMSSFAFHRPVVATRVGGLPEMVLDGKYGLLVEPGDEQDLASKMEMMLDNASMREQMSKAIEADYDEGRKSWKQTVQDYKRIYEHILDGNAHGR